MNEEKDPREAGMQPEGQQSFEPAVTEADGQTPETPVTAEAPVTPETPATAETPAPALAFDYGKTEAASEPRGSKKTFALLFGIFGGVCVLLLLLTFVLGKAGFKIIRDIHTDTDRTVYVKEYDPASGLLTPNEAADVGRKSTVTIQVKLANGTVTGSGFVYTADGHIVTNHHVIEDMAEDGTAAVQVVLADGTAVDATLVGSDAASDIAVLKIPAEKAPAPLAIGSSDALLTGDGVLAIGTPAKLDYAGTATFGSVSCPKRLVQMTDANGSVTKKMTLIQTDVSVNPGNSGGPLLDMYGKVVGVVVMKVSQYGGSVFEGIGFALPIDGVRVVADEIIQKGSFTGENPFVSGKTLVGITGHGGVKGKWYSPADSTTNVIEASDTEKAGYHYMAESGIYVMSISNPDAKLKLREGDIIMRVNGLIVRGTSDMVSAVNRYGEGESVTLTVYRDGKTLEIPIMLTAE